MTRLQDANLKVNAVKSNFCAIETEYLGYILSRDGIKPQPKEVQSIVALTLPTSVKELRRFLGMVQYYRDFWAKCSEILAPLTELVGECGSTKDPKTKKKRTPRKPWHWDPVHQQAFDNVKAAIAKEVTLAYILITLRSSRFTLMAPLLKRTGRLLSSVLTYLKLSKNTAFSKLNSWP
jgi:hypothetical protein